MIRTTRSRLVVAGVAGVTLACTPLAAFAGSGTGTVTTTVTATATSGALTIAGTGVAVSVSTAPGTFSSSIGATVLSVSDLTGTTNGWAVTATYSDPAVGAGLGADNVEVSTSNVVPNALGGVLASNVTTVTDQLLSTPVTVLTTGSNSGAGVTAATAAVKVRVPQTAQTGSVYGGVVTYTVASVR
ncbi:MAG TPA: hypothetical protein VKJ07_17045 [Mycobacteriales bacterium]|nr:hypothetical protein [Mycobacteriales bacterium]